jgi:hypothetical protein
MSESFENGDRKVLSPFSESETLISRKRGKSNALLIWGSVIALLILIGGGALLYAHLTDPLRTLEVFPVSKYLESYRSLQGAQFKGDLTVENDLGYKDGVGRLMVFSAKESTHPFVVMIPPHLASTYFTKGQHYLAELEVKEGGLVYANSCKKN